ncbi:MAG: hypothetical protein F4X72_13630 [Dehalococcoidia bacterium]|nr:hypothetical protein [Dehalococcoidia bacterium]
MFRVPWLIGLLVLAVLLMAADECEVEESSSKQDSPSTKSVKRKVIDEANYGGRWPLTAPKEALTCEMGPKSGGLQQEYVFADVASKRYAINGSARSLANSKSYQTRLYDV